jgi:NDP-sugar pyrophosphorylase family protein
VLGAIFIVEPGISETADGGSEGEVSAPSSRTGQPERRIPLACVEVLGRSVLERAVDDWRQAGVEAISLLADSSLGSERKEIDQAVADFSPTWVTDVWSEASQVLKSYQECQFEATVVARARAYAEVDASDILQFHRARQRLVTRAFTEAGPLDLWIVETAAADSKNILATLAKPKAVHYAVGGYVNLLNEPRDLRRLVVDSLSSRCGLRPQGFQVRPGVWMGEGAEIDKKARIVAPAFIGRKSKIGEQCLITRCSNVESNCHIDYGTVVENSSILSNSYVGIGLDVAHSIVNGNRLINLKRDVTLEIADPDLIRQNGTPSKEAASQELPAS